MPKYLKSLKRKDYSSILCRYYALKFLKHCMCDSFNFATKASIAPTKYQKTSKNVKKRQKSSKNIKIHQKIGEKIGIFKNTEIFLVFFKTLAKDVKFTNFNAFHWPWDSF